MEINDHNKIRRDFFDKYSQGWDERNYSEILRKRLENILDRVKLYEGMTVLDVCCGNGILQPYLRKRVGQNGRLAMLDFSPAMLSEAARLYPVSWPILSLAESIPLPDGYVDAVICLSAFPHIQDKEKAASEFFRVLKSGALAYVIHLDGREKLNALHDSHAAVHGDHMPCPNGMRAIFKKVGFSLFEADESDNHYFFAAQKE